MSSAPQRSLMFPALIINNNYHCRLKHTLKAAVFIFIILFVKRKLHFPSVIHYTALYTIPASFSKVSSSIADYYCSYLSYINLLLLHCKTTDFQRKRPFYLVFMLLCLLFHLFCLAHYPFKIHTKVYPVIYNSTSCC